MHFNVFVESTLRCTPSSSWPLCEGGPEAKPALPKFLHLSSCLVVLLFSGQGLGQVLRIHGEQLHVLYYICACKMVTTAYVCNIC